MSASQETCPLCQKAISSEKSIVIGEKGAQGINNASIERGDDVKVGAGMSVHKSCRMLYINKKYIQKSKKSISAVTSTVKRNSRVSIGPYDSKTDCLFCGNKIVKSDSRSNVSQEDSSFVKTDSFVDKILVSCKARADDWAFQVQGRIEYFGGDLHAADCVYHHSCDINFRTFREVPTYHSVGPSECKRKKVGRPKDEDQEQAFLRMCSFFEDNDGEQFTISDLANKMKGYLLDSQSVPYGNYYLKSKLVEHYGDSLFLSGVEGMQEIVTFREKTGQILRDFFNVPRGNDEETQKRAIIETAARLIKSDIKTAVKSLSDEYPETSELTLASSLRYIPDSLRHMLELFFAGKDTRRQVACIGQAIIQAVRPRTVIPPLQLGLAVQLHHLFRSRFLIDSLSAMGFCSSYAEVQRFEENAASSVASDYLGRDEDRPVDRPDTTLLFAADNVDHNLITLDGKGTFHGMGMIAALTPGRKVSPIIPRHKLADVKLIEQTKVAITDYQFVEKLRRSIKFQPLQVFPPSNVKVDLLWEMMFRKGESVPNWQGMMHVLHKDCVHPGQSSIVFLPMIDMYPGDKTCIYSTLNFLCKLAFQHHISPVVTFDQPLFWKAAEILNEVSENSPLREVVLLLGSFHTFMNVLGAIGTLMDGSGFQEILETIYGENAAVHMMNGKSVQRAFRGHILIDQCLTQMITVKLTEDNPDFSADLNALEQLYTQMQVGDTDLDSLIKSECLENIGNVLKNKKDELSNRSKTSKLWISYQRMIEVARRLLAADRTGSWKMHLHTISECLPIFAAAGHANYLKSAYLYLQKMNALEKENPTIHKKFEDGFHVIRRSNQYWSGLPSDLVIEQTLMRSLKTTGGLTRGSGMSEHQRALWTLSSPVCSVYNFAMQDFSQLAFTTSEQHKEATASRIQRDHSDLEKLLSTFESFSPFSSDEELRNVITGVTANDDVNVHELFEVGEETVKKMEGQSVFSYSHKRKTKVKTLASTRAVKVTDDRTIDPALLFQRFLVVSQSGELNLEQIIDYELCPYPLSLFEGKHLMRKPDKPQLAEAIRNHVSSVSSDALPQSAPETDHYVLDGGSLLHRLKWTTGCTYSTIAEEYASFTFSKYGLATVVFDGYEGGPSIKDNTHLRRSQNKVANKVSISDATKFVGRQDDFLSNDANKQTLIHLISKHLRHKGCEVIHAEGDADVDIVKATVAISSSKSVTLVGEDTDLLILILYYITDIDCKDIYFRSDKSKSVAYNLKAIRQLLGDDVCAHLLFVHAFTGCDTTSRIFGVGKRSGFQKLIKGDSFFASCSKFFCTPKADKITVESTGCKAMICLFSGKETDSLASVRYSMLCKKVARAKSFVTPERLPPTASATKYHSLRTYYQIMVWMGTSRDMDPTEWGWNVRGNVLVPVTMDKEPAPAVLLKMIHCKCSGACSTMKCSCRRHGLVCTSACGPCQESTCENMTNELIVDEDDEQD